MFNIKYQLKEVKPKNEPKELHNTLEGAICYPAYFNPGERGLFLYETKDMFVPVHRVRTSIVESVDHRRDGSFVVTTENTVYVFQALWLAK